MIYQLRMTEQQLDMINELLDDNNFIVGTYSKGFDVNKTECCFCVKDVINTDNISNNKIYFTKENKQSDSISYVEGDIICNIMQDKIKAYYFLQDKKYNVEKISVIGDTISFYFDSINNKDDEINLRNKQTFGSATVSLLKNLKIGVVGVSGTGSIVVEQLIRLGIGSLVLVDDDIIEEKNLNRIINSTKEDAINKMAKVDMVKNFVKHSGLNTKIITCKSLLQNKKAINEISQCDILFGCVDSIDGRHHLNVLSNAYLIPYFDVGVKLVADGNGGINEITTASHYIKPGGSSLLSRRVYNIDMLQSASLKRTDPEEYKTRLEEKYIKGAQESSPAVISVNMYAASMVVLDFLARIHQYRSEDTYNIATIRTDLTNLRYIPEKEIEPCEIMKNSFAKGDNNYILEQLS